ncbi:MAG: hypothetical protein J6P02_00820 [Lachnospiraceae bacterium]|nr:hypothetical protein [Lachnospiraceae bacterium]
MKIDENKLNKLVSLATELVSQVRAEALVALRFLDVALYKLKFKFDFNTTLFTDGEYLYMNPYHIFSLYKAEYNMLLRTYLHVILHCIFFHLFIDKSLDEDRWNLSCDIAVENIINELDLPTLVPDMQNPQIPEINVLKLRVGNLTAEKIYKFFMTNGITDEELNRLKNLFERDNHAFWFIDTGNEMSREGGKKKEENSDYKEQKKHESNDEEVDRKEHDEKDNDKEQEANNEEDYNKINIDQDEMEEDDDSGDEGSNLEGDKNKADAGEEENPNADSTNKSDINEDSKNEEARIGGMEVERPVDAKNLDKSLTEEEAISIQERINEQIGDGKDERFDDDTDNKTDKKADQGFDLRKKLASQIENASYNDWKKISERVKEDLLMFEKMWGEKTNTLKQYIKEINREKYNYETFLEKFAIIGENIELNDEEFDNIYYTYGLNMYENVPLVEPLEYKEVNKIKEFAIAIDVSGSVKGDLVQKFIEKTYNILSKRENFFSKVNIHIILCDTDIKNDYKITNLSELKKVYEKMVFEGFGGTDFRPVFDYIEKLRKAGEYKNLKGLIYFTDGLGDFPKKIPDYATAFCFIKKDYEKNEKKISVPSWAIKIVLEDI